MLRQRANKLGSWAALFLLSIRSHRTCLGFSPSSLATFAPAKSLFSSLALFSSKSSTSSPHQTIPVLASIPGQPPLLLGAELILNPPTPLQWYALEEAAIIQQKHQKERQEEDGQEPPATATSRDAGIDAAPIVALLDDTSDDLMTARNGQPRKRYATLAAVVGMALSSPKDVDKKEPTRDTDTFWFSLQSFENLIRGNNDNPQVVASRAKIRLVGVGRAALSDFKYRMPTTLIQDGQDEQGYLQNVDLNVADFLEQQQQVNWNNYNNKEECVILDDDDDEDNTMDDCREDDSLRTNIVMAQLSLLQDEAQRRDGSGGHDEGRFSSPVHGLCQMSTWAGRLHFVHQERQRLVAGLQAAKARLQLTGRDDEYLTDHDGLGQLFDIKQLPELPQEDEDKFVPQGPRTGSPFLPSVATITRSTTTTRPSTAAATSTTTTTNKRTTKSLAMTDQAAQSPLLREMENYGMGYSATSVCTLAAMTKVWMEKLAPYYSPEWQSREEYYYELFSFVATLALQPVLDTSNVKWTLTCTNTVQRLEQTHEWMARHVEALKQEARQASQELRDCGEECTDLW